VRESQGGKPDGAMKVKTGSNTVAGRCAVVRGSAASPARFMWRSRHEAEHERTCWYPKDGELWLARMKPEETLVEVRSDSDVQIDRQSWL